MVRFGYYLFSPSRRKPGPLLPQAPEFDRFCDRVPSDSSTPAAQWVPACAGADRQLSPGARAADVDLGRGFGEREIARTKPYRQVVDAEKRATELDQAALQVAHMGGPVDHQPLDLMKHRRVRRIVVHAE